MEIIDFNLQMCIFDVLDFFWCDRIFSKVEYEQGCISFNIYIYKSTDKQHSLQRDQHSSSYLPKGFVYCIGACMFFWPAVGWWIFFPTTKLKTLTFSYSSTEKNHEQDSICSRLSFGEVSSQQPWQFQHQYLLSRGNLKGGKGVLIVTRRSWFHVWEFACSPGSHRPGFSLFRPTAKLKDKTILIKLVITSFGLD